MYNAKRLVKANNKHLNPTQYENNQNFAYIIHYDDGLDSERNKPPGINVARIYGCKTMRGY
jgi:hypothetical protein